MDTLIDRVWGDRAPQRVRETLYGYLSRLRQALKAAPEVAIARRPGGYVLDADPLSVDLHRFRDLVVRARESDDTPAAALMRQALGLWRGDPFATVDVPWHRRLVQALSLAQESGQGLSEAHTHLALGRLHEHTGDRSAALRHDEKAVRLFARLGHRAGLARALNAVAWDHAQQGDHRAAVAHCEKAMAIQEELGDLRGQADTLDTLGYAYQQLGEHAQALACHRRGLELRRALGHRFNEAEALVHLGQVHRALGDPGAARRVLRQALDIYLDIEVHPSRVEQTRALLDSLGTGGAVAR